MIKMGWRKKIEKNQKKGRPRSKTWPNKLQKIIDLIAVRSRRVYFSSPGPPQRITDPWKTRPKGLVKPIGLRIVRLRIQHAVGNGEFWISFLARRCPLPIVWANDYSPATLRRDSWGAMAPHRAEPGEGFAAEWTSNSANPWSTEWLWRTVHAGDGRRSCL